MSFATMTALPLDVLRCIADATINGDRDWATAARLARTCRRWRAALGDGNECARRYDDELERSIVDAAARHASDVCGPPWLSRVPCVQGVALYGPSNTAPTQSWVDSDDQGLRCINVTVRTPAPSHQRAVQAARFVTRFHETLWARGRALTSGWTGARMEETLYALYATLMNCGATEFRARAQFALPDGILAHAHASTHVHRLADVATFGVDLERIDVRHVRAVWRLTCEAAIDAALTFEPYAQRLRALRECYAER